MSPQPKTRRPYKFVCVGQPVVWYPNGDRGNDPHAAVVDAVNERSLDLAVHSPETGRMVPMPGCPFVDETWPTVGQRMEAGGWDHTAITHAMYGATPRLGEWPDEREADAKAARAEAERLKKPAA